MFEVLAEIGILTTFSVLAAMLSIKIAEGIVEDSEEIEDNKIE